MPELPEVEFARRLLDRELTGSRITRAQVVERRIARPGTPATIVRHLQRRKVESVERRGKWLRIALDDGAALFSHLGMSGKWERWPSDAPKLPYERARIDTGGSSVRYIDPRMFGRMTVDADGQHPPRAYAELGPDPLRDPFTAEVVQAALGQVKKSIKEALLDQTRLAGIGNIQAAESLWRAKIHPARRANSLSPVEMGRLQRSIVASLRFTLALSPDDEIAYVEERDAPNPFRVYGKEGEPCPRCKTQLVRIVQAGRSTVFCPYCQPSPRAAAHRATTRLAGARKRQVR